MGAGICGMVNPPLYPISPKIDLHQLQNILYWNALSQPQRLSSLAVVASGLFWNGNLFQWVILQELKHHYVHTLCIPWDKGLPWLSIIASIYIRAALKLILREVGKTALSCQRNSWFNCWTHSPNLPCTSTMKSIGAFTGDKASLSLWCSAVAQLMERQAAPGTATNTVLCSSRTRIRTLAWLSSSYVIKFAQSAAGIVWALELSAF